MPARGSMSMRVDLRLALVAALVCAAAVATAQSSEGQSVQSTTQPAMGRDQSTIENRQVPPRDLQALRAKDEAQTEMIRRFHDALARTRPLFARASPNVRAWVHEEGRRMANGNPSESAVATAARVRFGDNLSEVDIDQIVMLVMMDVASDSDRDLRDQLARIRATNRQVREQRNAIIRQQDSARLDQASGARVVSASPRSPPAGSDSAAAVGDDALDGMSEMSEEQQLKLQMLMDRREKAFETISNLMKKQSDTEESIIGNLK